MIFYFSGTGNTRWAARKVADALGDRLVNIASEMRRVDGSDELLRYQLDEGERIGFFYPVHGWRPPKLVREFVGRLRIENADGHYCYAVCTAGDNIGETEDLMENDLAAVGLHVDSAISLIMPESYIALPFMDVDKPENEKLKKDVANRQLTDFIPAIKKRTVGIRNLVIGRWPRINSRLVGSVFLKKLVTDKYFRVDADKCVGCGKCVSVCPVGDIKLDTDNKPTWLHNDKCLTCFACYHHCHKRAIDFGKWTKGKGQYYY